MVEVDTFNSKEFLLENYPSIYGYVNIKAFNSDYRLFRSIRTMLNKDNINYKLLINNVIMCHNAFGRNMLKVIPCEFSGHVLLKVNTILTYLQFIDSSVPIDKNFLHTLKIEIEG